MSGELREPPHNDDAERSLLGSVFLDTHVLDAVASVIEVEDFYRESHRHIFRTMKALFASGSAVDAITVTNYLDADGTLEAASGAGYVARLTNEVPSAANAEHYANIVRSKSVLRSFISASGQLMDEAYQDVADVDSFMDNIERQIFDITQRGQARGYTAMRDVVKEAFTQIERLYQEKKAVTGVATGFVDLDHLTSGWQASDLIIVAARPAMGKTSFALNMMTHAAIEKKIPGALFSLEMSNAQLAIRMLCTDARIDQERLRRGSLTENEWHKLIKAAGKLSDANIFLDDTPSISVQEFRSKCRRLKAEHDIGIVFVDYLQLMRGSSQSRSSSREQEISEISRTLKAVAKELNIPVIALAQLNRGVESRADKRPIMSDLRESGAIEQDADIISFIYRDEVYDEHTEQKGIAEILVRKHRNGATGTITLRFFKEFVRFENLARDDI